jgi:Ca-activated chloride channel family protein
MTLRLLISLSLLLAWQKVCAQLAPAEDFFNGGAQLYISNNIPAALERVETGLKMYPEDEKLKKLEQLLKQQQQQNQQNQQQQQNNSQPQKADQQKQSDQKKDDQPKPAEPKKDSDDKPKDEQKEQQSQPAKAGELTPEEAKKLLDRQKDGEQLLQMKPEAKPRDPTRPYKDW